MLAERKFAGSLMKDLFEPVGYATIERDFVKFKIEDSEYFIVEDQLEELNDLAIDSIPVLDETFDRAGSAYVSKSGKSILLYIDDQVFLFQRDASNGGLEDWHRIKFLKRRD